MQDAYISEVFQSDGNLGNFDFDNDTVQQQKLM